MNCDNEKGTDDDVKAGTSHSWPRLLAIAGSWLAFIFTAIMNGLSTASVPGLFKNNTGNIAALFYLEITPSGWVFSTTWSLIYLWQVLFLIYALYAVFRRVDGPGTPYLYLSEHGICVWVYVLYINNMIINFSWLLLWDSQHIFPALAFIVSIQILLYYKLSLTLKNFPTTYEYFRNTRPLELVLRILFAHNGLAIYAGWLTIAPLLNLGACFAYGAWGGAGPLSQYDASTFMIVLLLVFVLVWLPLELSVLETRFRGVFAHFIPLLLGPIGILTNIADATNRNAILAIVIVSLVGIGLVVKIVITVVRIWHDSKQNRATTPDKSQIDQS